MEEGIFVSIDLTLNILLRLPGSSVVSIRSVCKLWNSITRNPNFIKTHLIAHSSDPDPPSLIIFSQEDSHVGHRYHLTVLDGSMKQTFRLTRSSDPILATPPCNGLICLFDYRRNIQICNPTTRQIVSLPRPAADSSTIANSFPKCFLGFHPQTEEYKVVRFFYREQRHLNRTYNLGCETFTLGKSHSWRYVGSITSYITGPGINVDGCVYWMSGVSSETIEKIIVLDLKSETFRLISPPSIDDYLNDTKGIISLALLEGRLCLVNSPVSSSGAMDIWMMKNSLWIHKYHVPIAYHLQGHRSWPEPVLVHNGKMLVRWGNGLYKHVLKTTEKAEKVYSDRCLGNLAKVYGFVESLMPLKASTMSFSWQ
ncbi:Putative F-box protein [Apostasia shenzhenica]|uniref:F-box protein n=1 Tax=Apostasia shenzhenica TaxID=1088818 RepID=A0A2I0A4N6_9ASPA|nr:Putative F-box protein [Apostasia shenzhenica]